MPVRVVRRPSGRAKGPAAPQVLPFDNRMDGIAWPALPDVTGMAIATLLYQFEQSQWWPAETLWRYQAAQLRRLVAHARTHVPYYRGWLDDLDLRADDERFREAWQGLPVLDRAAIQRAGDDLLSQRLPDGHGRTSEIYTSGSTGKPIRAVRSQLWRLYWRAVTLRDHLWHGRDLSGTLAVIRESGSGKAPYPDGDRARRWGSSSGGLFETGPSVSLNVTTPVDRQIDWLMRLDPHYLLTHPSIVERLATFSIANKVRLPRLHHVETIAEALRPRVRELCAEAWGVPVVDMYSAREAGYLALQCPDNDVLHVQSEVTLVEVVDASGRPCGPGEAGTVLVTPLHNFAMPMIRYAIGDVAEVGGPCPCGRGLPVLTRVLGRRQNMLILPSGEERWPLLSNSDIKALTALGPIRQYQFVQRRPEAVELRLAVPRALEADETAAIIAWVHKKFGYPFEVTVSEHPALHPKPSGKFEDFVSEIPR